MTKLLPFQKDGIQQIYDFRGRALLGDEQGLGKTIQALYWIKVLPRRRPAVIVCPSSVKYNWQVEAHGFGLQPVVIEGHRPKDFTGEIAGDIIILNYDVLRSWLPVLLKSQPRVMVLDECHYLKNYRAQRTVAAGILCAEADSVLALSGTPMPNKPIELWPVLYMVKPGLFPKRFQYAQRYCDPKHTRWGWKFDGAKRTKELHRILSETVLIRRLKKEVAPQLPDKTHKIIPFVAKSYAEYNKANEDIIKWLGDISPAQAKKAKRGKALAKIGYLLRLCADIKKRYIIEWVEEWSEAHPGKKLVGLTMHTKVIQYLKEAFPDSVVIDGSVTGKKRHQSVHAFQTNKDIRYMWGNWKAAGIGITATAAFNLVALDLPWTPGDLLQGQDRVHRIGQDKKVIIYYLLLLHTIEEKLMRALKKKSGILRAILDGKRPAKDFDMLDILIKDMHAKN